MLMEHLDHLKLNGALGVHGGYEKGTDHLRKECIILQSNGSSSKGTDHIEGVLEHLEEVWST